MKMLILSQTGAGFFKMKEWELSKLPHEFIILTTDRVKESYANFGNNVRVYSVESWSSTRVLLLVQEIWKEMSFERVFAIDEFDIELAAIIREYYKLPGQTVASSRFFRDKLYMNEIIHQNGLKAPVTQNVSSLFDVITFAQQVGYPIIVKPRAGAGTMNTVKLNGSDECYKLGSFDFEKENFIVQNFISGDLYHIDALIIEEEAKIVKTSKYLFPTLEHFENHSTASVQLTREEAQMFTDYMHTLLHMMPLPKNTILHLEVFYDGSDIYFLEIASRMGGGGIHAILTEQFGCDPIYAHLLADLDEIAQIPLLIEKDESSYGQIMVSPEIGRVESLPENIELYEKEMNIFDIRFFAAVGTVYETRETSVQAICRIALKGANTADVIRKLEQVEIYIKQHTKII